MNETNHTNNNLTPPELLLHFYDSTGFTLDESLRKRALALTTYTPLISFHVPKHSVASRIL